MTDAPSISNYYIGKGIVSFKKDGDAEFRDLGNVPEFEWTPAIEKLDHFSSREGVKSKDRSVVLSVSGSVRLVMDEWDPKNLAIALLGDALTNTDGETIIDIFSQTVVSGSLKFVGTNEVGPRYTMILTKVDFIPGSSLNLLSDEFGTIEITGEVSKQDGSFGTMTLDAPEGNEVTA
jgi:hypothetical protein